MDGFSQELTSDVSICHLSNDEIWLPVNWNPLNDFAHPRVVRSILKTYDLQPSSMDVLMQSEREALSGLPDMPSEKWVINWMVTADGLSTKLSRPLHDPSQPCTTIAPLGADISCVVVRIFNPNFIKFHSTSSREISQANQVQNEVASMHLIRNGPWKSGVPSSPLRDGISPLIPQVYAWQPVDPRLRQAGWIMMEFKPGEKLSTIYPHLPFPKKGALIAQLARMLFLIQDVRLPQDVIHHGGLTIHESGRIVSGISPWCGGPWNTFSQSWMHVINARFERHRSVLSEDAQHQIKPAISKIPKWFQRAQVSESHKTLIHGNLEMENILYSSEPGRITALLGFGSCRISHPSLEFILSFSDIGGNINFSGLNSATNQLFVQKIISRSASIYNLRHLEPSAINQYALLSFWNDMLAVYGAERPVDIKGISEIKFVSRISRFLQGIEAEVSQSTNQFRAINETDETTSNPLKWYSQGLIDCIDCLEKSIQQ